MSNADFRDRLQRIERNPTSRITNGGIEPRRGREKPNIAVVGIGGGFIGLGTHLLRKANENYEVLRSSDTPEMVLYLAGGGVVALFIGIVVLFRGIKSGQAARQRPQISGARKRLFSTLGVIVGFLFGFCIGYYVQLSRHAERTGIELDQTILGLLFLTTIAMFFICLFWSVFAGLWSFFRYAAYTFVGFVLVLWLFNLWIVNPYRVVSAFGFVH